VSVVQIPLRGSLAASLGLTAAVDEGDAEKVQGKSWYAVRCGAHKQTIYAVAKLLRGGALRTTYMHRLILGAAPGQSVDHADHNGLNNSRANIRLCTCSLNNANRMARGSAGGFRGVYQQKGRRNFFAAISVAGRDRRIGSFQSPMEAALAYDAAAREAFGAFAVLNFPAGA